jgi:hypothetical protein
MQPQASAAQPPGGRPAGAMPAARPALLLFAGLLLVYGALSPGAIHSMGYGDEELAAAGALVDAVAAWARLEPASLAPAVTRHGIVGLLVQLPFAALGRPLGGLHPLLGEAPLALVPVLATALLVLVVFAWSRDATGSGAWAFLLAVAAGFGTLLWPYAYLGMETTQSLALLVAGWLALRPPRATDASAPRPERVWPFALAAGVALGVKSTGIFLLPAVAYLAWRVAARLPAGSRRRRRLLGIAAVVLAVRAVGWLTMAVYLPPGRIAAAAGGLLDVGPIVVPLRLAGFLAGGNKGLLVYAPVAVLALLGCRAAACRRRPEVVFALLSFAGLALGFSLLLPWSEETWGPRYLHSAVAPLVVALGVCRGWRPPSLRRDAVLCLAVLAGVAVNALGVAVYYGTLHGVMTTAGESSLAAIQHDPAWNPVRFHAWVLGEWLADPEAAPGRPHPWVVERFWWYERPAGEGPVVVDVADRVRPQPFLLRFWHRPPPGLGWVPEALLLALLAGLGLLAWCARLVARDSSGAAPPP